MSVKYPDLPDSSFPDDGASKLLDIRDPYASEIPLWNQYQSYMAAGNLDAAQQVLTDNPNLQKSIINSYIIRKLHQDIIAVQRMFLDDIEKYVISVIEFCNEYDPSKAYKRYNLMLYNGQVYFCHKDAPAGVLPTDTQYFYPLTLKGEQGNHGVDFVPMGEWNKDFTYSDKHAVSWKGFLWYSIADFNTGNEPTDNSVYWKKFVVISQQASDISMKDGTDVETKITTIENAIKNSATKEDINTVTQLITDKTKTLEGVGIPTENTVGLLGQNYKDTSEGGRLYVCVDIKEVSGQKKYTWNKVVTDTDTPEIWKMASSTGTSGYPNISTVDKRCLVIDVGDNNILKYYDSKTTSWKPITSVWS